MQTRQIISLIYTPKTNFCYIFWSRKQEALAYTWNQIKPSPCLKGDGIIYMSIGKPLKLVDQLDQFLLCNSSKIGVFIFNNFHFSVVEKGIDKYLDKISRYWDITIFDRGVLTDEYFKLLFYM